MRVVLLYPPPWKIPAPGAPADFGKDGPPAEYREGDLDADFHQTPYGLFALGAAVVRAGHAAKIYNLSAFSWEKVEEIVRALDADMFGLSCWTANRRGVALVAELVKRVHPNAHVVVGGPHATPLAKEMLAHHAAIDTVVVGEGDATFLELVERLEAGAPLSGLAGALYRDGHQIVRGPERPSIPELDSLACPHDYFSTHIVMTSRGCPWQCTFCGAETTWGRGFRGQSVAYVLDALESALARLPVRMLQIKDDTFTTNKKRVLEICRGIRERRLNFFWSCDTRVDVLSDELLREMRLAGCQRLSLGVESGSPTILSNIHKKITVQKIEESTELAKKYGVHVRYYMMLGNRGETRQTFEETLEFLRRVKPHQYLFSCLSIYPGTLDFDDAEAAGWLDREVYFTGDFQELKTPFDASPEDTALLTDWFSRNKGIREGYRASEAECRGILERLGDHHAAHMDLAGACLEAGKLEQAESHARRALDLEYPVPGLAENLLACVAARRGDVAGVEAHLRSALRRDPQHLVVARNAELFHRFLKQGGLASGPLPELTHSHDFQLFERTAQPTLPGPLPEDFASWADPAAGGIRPSKKLTDFSWKPDARRRLPMLAPG
ncbi:MAG TPA: radical SAM protein [Polyangiaceae bacterium]|nr:radical SAM protein [Polyangiaceae bacterium]